MQFAVFLRAQPDGSFQASAPAIPDLTVSAPAREQAVSAVRCAIESAAAAGDLVLVEVPVPGEPERNPWLAMAGKFADDPTFDQMLEEIYATRDAEKAENWDLT